MVKVSEQNGPAEPARRAGGSGKAAPGAAADLTRKEDEIVEERANLRALAVYEVIRREGVEELKRPMASLWWSGIAAGLSIGFSIVGEGLLHAHLPDAPWRGLVESLGYSIGFLIVILGRYQLFTEITLTAVLPVLAEPSRGSFAALMRIWVVVLAANLVGTALFGAALASGLFLPQEAQEGILGVSRHLAEIGSGSAFWRGILGGWLVATVVWLLPSAEQARFAVILLLTALISALELSHVISGSVELFVLLFVGELGIGAVLSILLPLLAGNIVGGSALFALLAYGQVKEEMSDPEPGEPSLAREGAGS
ncbi:formate/nitrite transporter family protein [Aquabacter cavernae]|uniref:formate/nitrite transporter family protein n=1 Tax=Aquabacter cavernae TaxID=2496029 RepID=UPI000F8DDC96|nr:formate/nitrite transporter family protein [Aquabacter cavernae]